MKMTKIFCVAVCWGLLLTAGTAVSQVTLYSENFSDLLIDSKGQNGATYDMTGVSNWSINVAAGAPFSAGDYFYVTGGQFFVQDADGVSEANPCYWESSTVDISCYTNVTVSADLIVNTSGISSNYVRMYYSLDGGAFTAVGTSIAGNGANATRTASGLSGSTIKIRIAYWGTSSTGSMRHDNVLITGVEGYPTLQASGLTLTNYTGTSIDLSWTNGNGDMVLVVAKPTTASLVDPVKGSSYTADANYGSGSTTGADNYVVYNGSGTSVSITGLSSGTDYDFAVYAYNSACPWYNTSELFGSTLCTPPTTQCSGVTLSGITANSMDVSWTNGNGNATLVVARPTATLQADPTTGTSYTANNVYGMGSTTGTGNYVVYSGVGTSFTLSGLTSATNYTISVYTYFSATNCYHLSEATSAATTLTLAAPYEMDNINGSIINTCSGTFTDAGGAAAYGNSENYTATFVSSSGLPLKFDFSTAGSFDIDVAGDTLFFYDGMAATGTPIAILTYLDDNTQTTYSSQLVINTLSPAVTVRWKSNASGTDAGWSASISCGNPPVCASNPPAADIFGQATAMCNIANYCGTTSSYYGEDTPYNLIGGGVCPAPDDGIFGATIENNSWLKFEALATSATFDFNVTGGSCMSGIQVGVMAFNSATSTFSLKSPCALTDGGQLGAFTVTATGLTVGETYYLLIDGYAGDNCDYTIGVNTGVAVVNAGPDQAVCTTTATLSATSTLNTGTWTRISGSGTITDPNDPNTTVTGLGLGPNVFQWTTTTDLCGSISDEVTITSSTCLPVTLTSLQATCTSSQTTMVSWTTASESNNDYFVVERSDNNTDFVPVCTVDGAGNSNTVQQYSAGDTLNHEGDYYYRLRQIDFDGTVTLTQSVAVSTGLCSNNLQVSNISFSPEGEIGFDIQTLSGGDCRIMLYDAAGRRVFAGQVVLEEGSKRVTVQVSDISRGIYLLVIEHSEGLSRTKLLR